MAYHDDLLSQAVHLVHTAPSTKASLRRAVSAAYYAVFHFLIRGNQIAQEYLVSLVVKHR